MWGFAAVLKVSERPLGFGLFVGQKMSSEGCGLGFVLWEIMMSIYMNFSDIDEVELDPENNHLRYSFILYFAVLIFSTAK